MEQRRSIKSTSMSLMKFLILLPHPTIRPSPHPPSHRNAGECQLAATFMAVGLFGRERMRRTAAEEDHVSCTAMSRLRSRSDPELQPSVRSLDASLSFSNHPAPAAHCKQTPPGAADENPSRLSCFVSLVFYLSSGSVGHRAPSTAKGAALLSLCHLAVASNNKRLSPRMVTSG